MKKVANKVLRDLKKAYPDLRFSYEDHRETVKFCLHDIPKEGLPVALFGKIKKIVGAKSVTLRGGAFMWVGGHGCETLERGGESVIYIIATYPIQG
jgi:hypothetical protein